MNTNNLAAIKSASELASIDLNSLKSNEIGLSLLLLTIAQREAKRIQKLASIIDLLEDQIFDPSIVEHLTPSEQIQRYTLALQSTQQSSAYISNAIKSINWSDIETKILILNQESSNNLGNIDTSAGDLQAAAMKLLNRLSLDKN